jgi:hypothetical protein
VSLTGIACIEVLYPDMGLVRDVARISIDSIPHLEAVLAFPWGTHSKEDDLPPPVVKPRGLPKDLGLLVRHEILLYVNAIEAKRKDNPRAITAREAKKLKKIPINDVVYYLDPDVRCTTWLTLREVERAALVYAKAVKHPSVDLCAIAAMMHQYENQKPWPGGKRPKTRLVVWFT